MWYKERRTKEVTCKMQSRESQVIRRIGAKRAYVRKDMFNCLSACGVFFGKESSDAGVDECCSEDVKSCEEKLNGENGARGLHELRKGREGWERCFNGTGAMQGPYKGYH